MINFRELKNKAKISWDETAFQRTEMRQAVGEMIANFKYNFRDDCKVGVHYAPDCHEGLIKFSLDEVAEEIPYTEEITVQYNKKGDPVGVVISDLKPEEVIGFLDSVDEEELADFDDFREDEVEEEISIEVEE